jgi:hypothetical protein
MPERIFKYNTVQELVAIIKTLQDALTSGSTQMLRNAHTGFLVETGPISQADLKRRLMEARYEIYTQGVAGNSEAVVYEPTNPMQEKAMRVESTYAPPYFLTSPYGA